MSMIRRFSGSRKKEDKEKERKASVKKERKASLKKEKDAEKKKRQEEEERKEKEKQKEKERKEKEKEERAKEKEIEERVQQRLKEEREKEKSGKDSKSPKSFYTKSTSALDMDEADERKNEIKSPNRPGDRSKLSEWTQILMLGAHHTLGVPTKKCSSDTSSTSVASSLSPTAPPEEVAACSNDYKFEFAPAGGMSNGGVKTPAHSLEREFSFSICNPNFFADLRETLRKHNKKLSSSSSGPNGASINPGLSIGNDKHLAKSLQDAGLTEFVTNSASGALFALTADRRYILKSASKPEMRFFRSILSKYGEYLEKFPDSVLCRIIAHFIVEWKGKIKNFIVMLNVDGSGLPAAQAFDLKGSEFNRKAKEHDFVGLDANFTRPLEIERYSLASLLATIARDVSFLRSLNIMDYSLFVSIHRFPSSKKDEEQQGQEKQQSVAASSSPQVAASMAPLPISSSSSPISLPSTNSSLSLSPSSPSSPASSSSSSSSSSSIDPEEKQWRKWSSKLRASGAYVAPRTRECFFVGIIDMLQIYDSKRKAQTAIQGTVIRKEISVVDPDYYSTRFLKTVAADIQGIDGEVSTDDKKPCVIS